MLFVNVLVAILIAAVVGVFFYYVFKFAGPWGNFWAFLTVLILAGVAAGAWIEPFGPVVYEVAWVPVLFVIFLFALLLAALSPPSARRTASIPEDPLLEVPEEEAPFMAISAVFWIFLAFLLVAAVIGIVRQI